MKCPKCGADNPDYVVYCGSCSHTIKEFEKPTADPESQPVPKVQTATIPFVKSGFLRFMLKLGGVVGVVAGTIVAIIGVYGISGGTGIVFQINDEVVSPEEGGQAFLIAGVVVLAVALVLGYIGFKKKTLSMA